ncbi:Hypothetical protein NTJ_02933 [Nesidiocoris tenuis]|uniref:Uncharacterized protein n=1 Tax=Nesidiocoris tenuis TaxID=355587 RepID=A0ABN7ACW0_9HEMI|nr:Hypothetical protein NTJ_02933 [Nesidiocoris tenuis]
MVVRMISCCSWTRQQNRRRSGKRETTRTAEAAGGGGPRRRMSTIVVLPAIGGRAIRRGNSSGSAEKTGRTRKAIGKKQRTVGDVRDVRVRYARAGGEAAAVGRLQLVRARAPSD